MQKKLEWIGFIITIIGLSSTIFLDRQIHYYSYIIMGIGAVIAFTSFFSRKYIEFKNK